MENRLFNEEPYLQMVKMLKADPRSDAKDDLALIDDIMASFHRYVGAVVKGELELSMTDQTDGSLWRETISQYDQSRYSAHELAIQNTRLLNRLAQNYGLKAVYLGDPDQRHQVAAFCLEVDQFFFQNRRIKLS